METVSRVHDLASLKFRNGNLGWLGNSKIEADLEKVEGQKLKLI